MVRGCEYEYIKLILFYGHSKKERIMLLDIMLKQTNKYVLHQNLRIKKMVFVGGT